MHWQWVVAVSAQQIACVRYVRMYVVLLRSHLTISAENTSMYFITTKFIRAAPASLKLHASMYVCMLYGNMYTYVATRSSVTHGTSHANAWLCNSISNNNLEVYQLMYTDSYSRIRVSSLICTLRMWGSAVQYITSYYYVFTHNVGLIIIQHSLFTPLPHSLYQAYVLEIYPVLCEQEWAGLLTIYWNYATIRVWKPTCIHGPLKQT